MTRLWRYALPVYLLAEVLLTLQIAALVGVGRTLLLLLLGVVAGVTVLRREQLAILSRLRRASGSGEPVLPGLLRGAMRAIAGILLIIPGFLSDVAALALLIPASQRLLVERLSGILGRNRTGSIVIEGEYRQLDDPSLPKANRDTERA